MTDVNYINYNPNSTETKRSKSTLSIIIGSGLVGAGAGAIYGTIKKVPVINNTGEINDTFTKTVYNKYLKNTTDEELKLFEKQRLDMIDKIKNMKKPEELKKLIADNKTLIDKILAPFNQTAEDFANNVKRGNMKKNKKYIINSIENEHVSRLNNIRTKISECWDGASKKLKKAESIPNELYKSIKSAKRVLKAKQAGKAACLGGVITGIVAFLTGKIIDIKKNPAQAKQPI